MSAGAAATPAERFDVRDAFERIYRDDLWGGGSGEGSRPEHNGAYSRYLEGFIRERGVTSVLDLGCGDWQFSRLIDWGGAAYTGVDVVASVVEANTRAFARPGVEFRHYDGDPASLPGADLLVVKDVLQHWSNASVQRLLPCLARYRWALITNCVSPNRRMTTNRDIADGQMRHLDLRREPFNLAAREVMTFTDHRPGLRRLLSRPRWKKLVLLVENHA